tara:strand:+ start:461 stop:742 length:282 start_codon:yes stop_codon:yes gene_type:complete
VNLGEITMGARVKVLRLDKKFIGTEHYMGVAYFWGHEYKHTMRDLSYAKRRKIHNLGLDRDIDFIKPNKEAWYLIAEVLKCDINTLCNIKEVA